MWNNDIASLGNDPRFEVSDCSAISSSLHGGVAERLIAIVSEAIEE
jgi:hypothetical protein